MFDVIVIGGSYAGISASLQLGRARKRVLVLDAGVRRNRFASHAHGLLGQDGVPPGEIAAKGKAEVLAYPTVTWQEAVVSEARVAPDGFVVRAGAQEHRGKRLVLAHGVSDELQPVPGLAERWGRHVFHCPYCHGYELNRGALGVLGANAFSVHSAQMVSEWGPTTLFVNDLVELDAEQRALLLARDVRIVEGRVVAVENDCDVRLEDGQVFSLAGLFAMPRLVMNTPFAAQLGCELSDGPLGAYYKVDPMTRQTTVPGVFAAGDASTMMGALPAAVADGALAGVGAHRSLIFGV